MSLRDDICCIHVLTRDDDPTIATAKIRLCAIQNGMLFKMRNFMYCTMQPQTVYIASLLWLLQPPFSKQLHLDF